MSHGLSGLIVGFVLWAALMLLIVRALRVAQRPRPLPGPQRAEGSGQGFEQGSNARRISEVE
jgi:hypothetical protein